MKKKKRSIRINIVGNNIDGSTLIFTIIVLAALGAAGLFLFTKLPTTESTVPIPVVQDVNSRV